MLAESADQQKLLNLADLDQEVGRVQHAARSLPEHQKITDLMAARQGVTDALVSATTEVDDLRIAVRRAEADLVPVRARLERNVTRVGDGSVSDGKVLRGLQEEVEHLHRRISDLEDIELDLMGDLEVAEARQAEFTAKKGEIEARLREVVAERDQAVAKLSAEAKDLAASRAAVAGKVPPPLMTLYEKLRSHSGTGAAMLQRGRCTGCQLEIPVSDLDTYRRAPANEVLRCVECDRILVRTPESGL